MAFFPSISSPLEHQHIGTSQTVQWLGLHTPSVEGMGSIHGRGTRSRKPRIRTKTNKQKQLSLCTTTEPALWSPCSTTEVTAMGSPHTATTSSLYSRQLEKTPSSNKGSIQPKINEKKLAQVHIISAQDWRFLKDCVSRTPPPPLHDRQLTTFQGAGFTLDASGCQAFFH